MLSVHTSPLAQPGQGDAGGMNVYVDQLSRALVQLGVEVEVLTRKDSSALPSEVLTPGGYLVRHIEAGPYEGLNKHDLPSQLCTFTASTLRLEAHQSPGWFDAVHSHYWLSGQIGLVVSERWGVPHIHSMHTLAKTKNRSLAPGDQPDPQLRIFGEEQVLQVADRVIANTSAEEQDLITDYGVSAAKVQTVMPGVDLEIFTPGDRLAARKLLNLPAHEPIVLFAGRVQPLKGPDVAVAALAQLQQITGLRPRLVVLGGASGRPTALQELERVAAQTGVADQVSVQPPVPADQLVHWMRAADVVVVPSRSETFGFVAAEAQASGVAVIAADVGGLRAIVQHEQTGLLVPGHDPQLWAQALARVLQNPELGQHWGQAGAKRAHEVFNWHRVAQEFIDVYRTSQVHTYINEAG